MNATVRQQDRQASGSDAFRCAMRELASGITVITHGGGGAPTGFTATSVSSLSSDPPSLLVCVNTSASLYTQLRQGDLIGVNVLGCQHAEIADRFAGRAGVQGAERFRLGRWIVAPNRAPLLADALAMFECEVEDIIERHTHAIVIGRVRVSRPNPSGGALIHWRGVYDRIGWSAEELRAVGLAPTESGGVVVRMAE